MADEQIIEVETQGQEVIDAGGALENQPDAGGAADPAPAGGNRFQERISELVSQKKLADEKAKWEAERSAKLEELLTRLAPPPAALPDPDEDPQGYVRATLEQERNARRALEQDLASMKREQAQQAALNAALAEFKFGGFETLAREHLHMASQANPKADLRVVAAGLYQQLGLHRPKQTPQKQPVDPARVAAEKKALAETTREPKPATVAPPPMASPPAPAKLQSAAELKAEIRREMQAAVAALPKG